MGKRQVLVTECRCERCGHIWKPRDAAPKICPVCKSAGWNERRNERRLIAEEGLGFS